MWKPLARMLGFGNIILEIEDHNPEGKSHCFATLFVLWKKRSRPKFTWASLINALESINEVEQFMPLSHNRFIFNLSEA